MSSPQDPSNWTDALRRRVEAVSTAQQTVQESDLRCPSCLAANRPGVTYVSIEAPDRAFCIVCSRAFDPRQKE